MVRINLIPAQYIEKKKRKQKIACIIIILCICAIWNISQWAIRQAKLSSLTSQVAKVEAEIEHKRPLLIELETLMRENAAKLEDLKMIRGLEKGRLFWIRVLEKFCISIADHKIWWTGFTINRPSEEIVNVSITGIGLSNFDVVNYMLGLMEHFEEVTFEGLSLTTVGGYPVTSFNLRFNYVEKEEIY